ncbi:MAG: lamin tail domain-containing protein [Deltaproteobacteria bacterium]|nr:lamin tail domain-containing protein [Deltaproteobacteria bacterium]MCB9786486.1 lamin tail domain-containing protein [Deltaproteobacteria bacterium]
MRVGGAACLALVLAACSTSDDGVGGTDLGSDAPVDAVVDGVVPDGLQDLAADPGDDPGSDAAADQTSDPGPGDATTDAPGPDADASTDAPGLDVDAATDAPGLDVDVLADASPDVVADAGPDIPEPDVEPDFDNCSEPGGDRNIYDLQNPGCPDHITPEPTAAPGISLTVTGVIVTGLMGDTFFVQEPAGGPYSGIAVYNGPMSTAKLVIGDIVDVEGSYLEFFDTSQITLKKFTKTGHTDPPEPFDIVHPSHIATGGPLAEPFEGVLVRVHDVATTHTRPDCPNEFGEFEVTGGLRIDDMGFLWVAHLGDEFASITGVHHYSFGNHKVEPRDADDIDATKVGSMTAISKCFSGECIAALTAPVSREVIVNEVLVDPFGDDTGQEWFELRNTTGAPIDLAGWTVRDCATQKLPLAGDGLVVPAGGYFVLGAQANPVLNGDVPVDYAYGNNGFFLPNTVGAVLIYDASGSLVDQMRYSRFDPFKNVTPGVSMVRLGDTSDGTLPESWGLSKKKWGPTENKGTPGAAN